MFTALVALAVNVFVAFTVFVLFRKCLGWTFVKFTVFVAFEAFGPVIFVAFRVFVAFMGH